MAKSSFAKRPDAKPAAAAPKPAPAATPKPAPASRPTPAATPKPAPASRPAPTAAAPKPTPASRPAPAAAPKPSPKPAAKPTVIDADTSEHVPAPEEQMELALPTSTTNFMQIPLGQVAGDFRPTDFSIPKLKVAQSIGPLAQLGFTPGDIVLNDAVVVGGSEYAALEITILRCMKQFVEDLPYDPNGDTMPRIYDTEEAANADGLSTLWGPNGEKPQAFPQLQVMVLVKCPEGLDPSEFTIEIGDNLYALAMWRLSGTAYPLVKNITAAQRGRLRGGLHHGSFLMTTQLVTKPKVQYYVPVLQPGTMHDEATIAAIEAEADQ